MRVIVIGGTGHIGTYLIPKLKEEKHEVITISRGERNPYIPNSAWNSVEKKEMDREKLETEGKFGKEIKELNPEIVIDLICFKPKSAKKLVNAIEDEIQHLITCGSLWVHGPSREVPTKENEPRNPIGEYGKNKAKIENYLKEKSRKGNIPATILHPGHIVGKGWTPVNPAGNFNPKIFEKIAKGEKVILPNLGMETLHHVHADDVAQAFICALNNWNQTIGESFHIASPAALTLRGYAKSIAQWFGQSADLKFKPWKEWKENVSDEEAEATWDHIAHSPTASIEKARKRMGYNPRYSSLQAVKDSIKWLIENNMIET